MFLNLHPTSRIFRHSLQVLREHRKLLLFPVLHLLAAVALFAFFLPGLFQVEAANAWSWLWHFGPPQPGAEDFTDQLVHPWSLPLQWLGAAFLAGTLAMTFINFAFYSQALIALNGGSVSVARGLALALVRLPVIAAWALFSGTIGVVVWCIEKAFPMAAVVLDAIGVSLITRRKFFGHAVWLGVPWHVAARFVVPVMVNEPRTMSPVGYLKASMRLLRRQWDDGLDDAMVIGIVSPTAIAPLIGVCACVVAYAIGNLAHLPAVTLWGLLLGFAILCLAACINGIFRCAMYIYASEGVPPGPFDAEVFDSAWVVRSRWSVI